MKGIIKKLKNAYLYAYYECYSQTHYFYKDHKNKNFYSDQTLSGVILFLLIFPSVLFFGNRFNIGKWMYLILIAIGYGQIYFTSWLVGEDDLTDKINSFYADKKTIKESRRIVLLFIFFCILFWGFVIWYNYNN